MQLRASGTDIAQQAEVLQFEVSEQVTCKPQPKPSETLDYTSSSSAPRALPGTAPPTSAAAAAAPRQIWPSLSPTLRLMPASSNAAAYSAADATSTSGCCPLRRPLVVCPAHASVYIRPQRKNNPLHLNQALPFCRQVAASAQARSHWRTQCAPPPLT